MTQKELDDLKEYCMDRPIRPQQLILPREYIKEHRKELVEFGFASEEDIDILLERTFRPPRS